MYLLLFNISTLGYHAIPLRCQSFYAANCLSAWALLGNARPSHAIDREVEALPDACGVTVTGSAVPTLVEVHINLSDPATSAASTHRAHALQQTFGSLFFTPPPSRCLAVSQTGT
jgi:hypothetical protein